SITATASGSSNYEYQLNSGVFQSSNKFENLGAGAFTVNVKDGDGCTATGNSTISAPAIIAISNLTTVPATCDGAIGSISFIASGGTGALKFKLGSGAFQTSSTFSNLSGGSYILTVQDENGCLITQNNIVVGGKAVPVISAQPTDTTNCEGNTATFEITASNVTSYQWQQQLPGGTFTNISGENTNELRLSNVGNSTSPHLANYRVTLQNDGCEIISEAATLTVNSIAGSNEDKTLCLGSDYTLDLANYTLTGTVSGYQWQYRNGTSGSWTDLANGTNYVLPISNFQTSNSGYYRCRITFENSSGTCIEYNETGNGLKLDVIENSPPIINTDQTQICGTGSATITATGCVGIVTWSTGETGTSISVASAGNYTAVCSLDNCESAVSNTIEIAIGTAPTTPTITADTLFLCNAEMATLTAINCNGIITWSTAATGATLIVGKGSYYAICETPCGISSASNEVIIEGNGLPKSGTIEATTAINCAGYNPPTITNSVSPTGESLTIQWQQRITSGDWADIDGATSLTYNPSALSETTLYRRRVSSTCGEAFSNVDTIYIAPDPSVIVTSSKSLICSNETFTLNATVNGGSGNCPISWQRNDRSSAAGSSFWEDISGTAESLTINNLSNASTENVSVYYRVVVDCQPTSCNKATADAFEIIVQPSFEFDLNFADSTICEGNTAIITATGCGGVISWSSGESTSSVTVSPTASTNYMAT
ncbi:MAG: hypothetical protein NWP83_09845, partial [Spirosomaceae bacterium]|nr:hypothetical protein [Spirosomataceae bacterium]